MNQRRLFTGLFLLTLVAAACAPTPAAAPAAAQPAATRFPATAAEQPLPQTGATQASDAPGGPPAGAPAVGAPAAGAPAAGAPDPARLTGVAKAYIETANTGNFDQALAFFAPDAVVLNPLGLFIGKEQVAGWLKQDVQTTRAKPEAFKMEGPLVVANGQVSLARFQKAGIEAVSFRSEYLIGPDGLIHYFSPAVTLTPEQQATMKAAGGAPPPAPAVDPVSVVKSYVEAANTGNFDQALAFYAEESAALVMNGTRLLPNRQAIAEWLKQDVQATRAAPQEWQANGNLVINTGTVTLGRLKALGIESVPYRAVYLVEQGKIRFFSPRLILTPEQQAIIAAAPKP